MTNMSDNNTDGLRPIGKIWGFFRWSLIGYIIASTLMVLSNIHLHIFLLRAFEGEAPIPNIESEGLFLDAHQAIIAISTLVMVVLAFVSYARFFQRSMYNARLLEPNENTVSPMGMWLWNIVPFASFWMPFKGVRQVWDIMRANAGEEQNYPATFGIWWILWVISSIISNISWRLPGGGFDFVLSEYNYGDLLTVNWMDMVAGTMTAISAFALLSIATKIANLQKGFSLESPSRLKEVFE